MKVLGVIKRNDLIYPQSYSSATYTYGGTADTPNRYLRICTLTTKSPWEVILLTLLVSTTNTSFSTHLLHIHIDTGSSTSAQPRGEYFTYKVINKGNQRVLPTDFYLCKVQSDSTCLKYELYINLRYTWMSTKVSVLSSFQNPKAIKLTPNNINFSTELPTSLKVIKPSNDS